MDPESIRAIGEHIVLPICGAFIVIAWLYFIFK